MIRSPKDAHDDHMRKLLDQRNARAQATQGCLSTLSECSDTPSIYSHPYFSPKSYDKPEPYTYHSDYEYNSPISHSDNRRGPIHDISSSMLNFDDDPRSSFAPSESYPDELSTVEDEDDQESVARMSYLGPKMRFHSRAPWELEGNSLNEEDEPPEELAKPFVPGFPFSLSSGSKAVTSCSSSPRPSYTGRPSGESTRSTIPPKRSFETINSQISYSRGALYALAQESLSSSSLARPSHSNKEPLRSKFSLGRLRSDAPISPLPPSPSAKTFTNIRSPASPRGYVKGNFSSQDTYSYASSDSRAEESRHPYANPDLVETYADESAEDSLPQNIANYPPSRNDSSITVMQLSPSSAERAALHPDGSGYSTGSNKLRGSAFQARDISSPVSVVTSSQHHDDGLSEKPPGFNNLPGWTDRNGAPAFSLISLEEARAQRIRSTTTTTVNHESRVSTLSNGSNLSAPFPATESEGSNLTHISDSSGFGVHTSWNRGRSISAGATKAKNAIQTLVGQPKFERRESEPAVPPLPSGVLPQGKALKHKKSGFMRLFNGSKSSDKDEVDEPPPVPSLPAAERPNISPTYQAAPRPKVSIPRIPVPSISQSLLDASSPTERDSGPQYATSLYLSPKRSPPALSISTDIMGRSSTSAIREGSDQPQTLTVNKPWLQDQPQSAPPTLSEFPSLKLRPISTLFSSHFEHIVSPVSQTKELSWDEPSPNTVLSPITPVSDYRDYVISSDSVVELQEQDTVKTLQEQLASAKKDYQMQIWELQGQVRDLKTELEKVKGTMPGGACVSCGKEKGESPSAATTTTSLNSRGVINRPRARTGSSTRFGRALP